MNEPKSDGGSAFPHIEGPPFDESGCYHYSGMTLRQYYAAAALQGIYSNQDISKEAHEAGISPADFRKACAQGAFLSADAMLAYEQNETITKK